MQSDSIDPQLLQSLSRAASRVGFFEDVLSPQVPDIGELIRAARDVANEFGCDPANETGESSLTRQ